MKKNQHLEAMDQRRQIIWILILMIVTLFPLTFLAALIKALFLDFDLRAILTLIGSSAALTTILIMVFRHYFPKQDVDKNLDNDDNFDDDYDDSDKDNDE